MSRHRGSISSTDNYTAMLREYVGLRERTGASPNSIRSYKLFVRYVQRYLGTPLISTLSVMDFNRFEQRLLTPKRAGGQGLSRNSVLAVHHFLRGAFNHFVNAGVCTQNPLVYVTKPTPERVEAASLDEWDFNELDAALERELKRGTSEGTTLLDVAFALGAWLSLRTGLRVGEVCALRRKDVSRVSLQIHVGGTVVEERGHKPRRKNTTKGRRSRNIAVTQDVIDVVFRVLALQDKSIPNLRAGSPLLTQDGNFLRPTLMSSSFRHLNERLGLPQSLSFHSLRHTHATWCLANGVDIKTLSERLGHADVATTLRIYAHVMPGRDAIAAHAFAKAAAIARGASN
ncbi:site-specific integrase [Collinsella sp. zg1085]|uniref:tyrosine-type recombinase/integrase n=1 Tax=Collinsella sp. zg1085 TaxID=2844380 RepID=UPI001C0BA718|nr:site-specific integrase [Collinsella sp. zg1085]QWT18114.1 site-specific integrase [Collinsella sp. zg1085]